MANTHMYLQESDCCMVRLEGSSQSVSKANLLKASPGLEKLMKAEWSKDEVCIHTQNEIQKKGPKIYTNRVE